LLENPEYKIYHIKKLYYHQSFFYLKILDRAENRKKSLGMN
jgi:hypothetical protein